MKKRTITEENEQDVDVNKINLEEGSSWDKKFSELKNEIIQLNKKITSTQQKHKKRINILKKKITRQEQQSKKQMQVIIQTTNKQLKPSSGRQGRLQLIH